MKKCSFFDELSLQVCFPHFYDFTFQGRDATDQHIVDVVLKMLQGEKQSLFFPQMAAIQIGCNQCVKKRAVVIYRTKSPVLYIHRNVLMCNSSLLRDSFPAKHCGLCSLQLFICCSKLTSTQFCFLWDCQSMPGLLFCNREMI